VVGEGMWKARWGEEGSSAEVMSVEGGGREASDGAVIV
jgi:hypothetical protein